MPSGFAPPAAADSPALPYALAVPGGSPADEITLAPGDFGIWRLPAGCDVRGAASHPVAPSTGETTRRQAEDLQALNKQLDLICCSLFTEAMTAERAVRSHRSTGTREAILSAAEWLFAERGMYAVSNRQISEAAGQGNNAAACYHFGTRTDLLRAIESKHREPIEQLRATMLIDIGDSTELRDWVGALVRPLTEHLAALGTPSWYARFAAQAMADPTYRHVVTKGALTSPMLVQTIDGINRCLPDLPKRVRVERIVMVRNLLMHTCAEHEGALAEHGPQSRSSWPVAGEGLIDAIVGLWRAPVRVSMAGG
jgi:AcrR family transcriptional regulator